MNVGRRLPGTPRPAPSPPLQAAKEPLPRKPIMPKPTRIFALVIAFILVILLAVGLTTLYLAQNQPNRGVAMEDLLELYHPETKPLGAIVVKTYREFRGNTIKWSAAYFGCLFGSALLSAMAGLVLKLELLDSQPKIRNDLAAAMATIAALLVTLSTTGDFQRKWQANRTAAAAMENLAYELVRPAAAMNLNTLLTLIQTINEKRNRGIIGEPGEAPSLPASPQPPLSPEGAKTGAP